MEKDRQLELTSPERAEHAPGSAIERAEQRAWAAMEQRTRQLARSVRKPAGNGRTLELLTFRLSNERYAVEARYVRNIMRLTDLTLIPQMPDFLMGLTNLRGEILAVMDLRRLFGLAVINHTELSRLVVLGEEYAEFGFVADAIDEVRQLALSEIASSAASLGGLGREYLRGVTSEALIVLDTRELLTDKRLMIG